MKAILDGFEYLLTNNNKSFVIGQGLWSPWYVGNSMSNLDKKFGQERIIDTPVSEGATQGSLVLLAKNASCHPRDGYALMQWIKWQIEAAKWKKYVRWRRQQRKHHNQNDYQPGGEQGALA